MASIVARYRSVLLAILLLAVMLLVLQACAALLEDEEAARVASPDGVVDAVIEEYGGYGGATTGHLYAVYVVPAGEGPGRGEPSVLSGKLVDPELHWLENGVLEIRYRGAGTTSELVEEWRSEEVQGGSYEVEVRKHLRRD